jgi:excisionase family DNA binding protein
VNDTDIETWLSPSEAGRRIGISGQRVRELIDAGKLPARRTVLGRLVPTSAVEAEIQRRQEKPQGRKGKH